MRIGIISDTHGLLREEVKELLRGCDAIFHAGDVCELYILQELEEIAPVYAARGNNDWSLMNSLPWKNIFELEGKKIMITHIKEGITEDWSQYDLIVYGHTHRYALDKKGDTIWINPGSCGPCVYRPITLALAELDEQGFHIEKCEIPSDWSY